MNVWRCLCVAGLCSLFLPSHLCATEPPPVSEPFIIAEVLLNHPEPGQITILGEALDFGSGWPSVTLADFDPLKVISASSSQIIAVLPETPSSSDLLVDVPSLDVTATISTSPSGDVIALSIPNLSAIVMNEDVNGDGADHTGSTNANRASLKNEALRAAAIILDEGGDDTVINDSDIDVEVSAGTPDPAAQATVIDLGLGDDTLTNNGLLSATAISLAVSANTSRNANAEAMGVRGGGGNDVIHNEGNVMALATATATAVDVAVTHDVEPCRESSQGNSGGGGNRCRGKQQPDEENSRGRGNQPNSESGNIVLNASVEADAEAIGIDGDSDIRTRSTIDYPPVTTTITDSPAPLTTVVTQRVVKINEDIITTANGDDIIDNAGTIVAEANAETGPGDETISMEGSSLADSTATARATATAIRGGGGDDTITNTGELSAAAAATADAIVVYVSSDGDTDGLDAEWVGSVGVEATAVGIDGDSDGRTRIIRHIDETVTTTTTISSPPPPSLPFFPTPTAGPSTSTTTTQVLTIDEDIVGSASGNDTIINEGVIDVAATASSGSAGASIDVEGVISAESASSAIASATAIRGGGGNDAITNTGQLAATAGATAEALEVNVSGGSEPENNDTAWVGDVAAEANAVGIDGDSDTLRQITRDTFDTTISPVASVPGTPLQNVERVDEVRMHEQIVESANGDDTIDNSGAIVVAATASSGSGDASINIEDITSANATSTASADATAIRGGGGNDAITNTGQISATAEASADAISGSISGTGSSFELPEGPGEGERANLATIIDSVAAVIEPTAWDGDVAADAVAVGIDGDSDFQTQIVRETTVTSTYERNGESVVPLPDLPSTFEIADLTLSASGNDTIVNSGGVDAVATATTGSMAETTAVEGTAFATSDLRASSGATAIRGGAGDDTITNTGELSATSDAVTTATNRVVAGSDATAVFPIAQGKGSDEVIATVSMPLGNTVAQIGQEASASAVGIDGDSDAGNSTQSFKFEGLNLGLTDIVGLLRKDDTIGSLSVEWLNKTDSISGNDAITNDGTIDAVATASSGSTGQTRAEGAALTASTSLASGSATAIRGGGGGDSILNTGQLSATAEATATAANLAISGSGKAFEIDIPEKTTITLPVGAVVRGGAEASASAVGIDGDGIDDTRLQSLTASIETDIAGVLPLITSSANPHGNDPLNGKVAIDWLKLIESAGGHDRIENDGVIDVVANASSGSADASMSVETAALTDSKSLASAQATAIRGGGGNDAVMNTGHLSATAEATAAAANLAISGLGGDFTAVIAGKTIPLPIGAIARGGAEASATAVGIEGDGDDETQTQRLAVSIETDLAGVLPLLNDKADSDGDEPLNGVLSIDWINSIERVGGNDTVENDGVIDVTATAIAPELVVPGTGVRAALGISDSMANSRAVAIDLGGGKDALTNTGSLNSTATSIAAAANIPLSGVGASVTLGGSEAEATATGIAADDDGDKRTISISAEVETDLAPLIGRIAETDDAGGSGGLPRSSLVVELASSIESAGDDDTVINDGDIEVTATAVTPELEIPIAVLGATVSVSDAKATSRATGIDLGGGDDELMNTGPLNATATSVAAAANIPVTGVGLSLALGGPEAEANAVGIDADGRGNNLMTRTTVDLSADGITKREDTVTVGTDPEETTTTASTAIENGRIELSNETILTNSTGNDTITNDDDIEITATAVTPELDLPVAVLGAAVSVSDAKATAQATGIDLGGGDDELTNTGLINATATAAAVAANIPLTGAALSLSLGGPEAVANAVGIDADGADNDVATNTTIETSADGFVKNEETVTTTIIDELVESDKETTITTTTTTKTVDTNTDTEIDDGRIALMNETTVSAVIGDDTVTNEREIEVTATAVTPELDVPAAALGAAVSVADAKATTQATGIDLGGGDDVLTNTALLNATATSVSVAASIPVTGAGVSLSLGGPESVATAVGIDADGAGKNLTTATSLELSAAHFDETEESVTETITVTVESSDEAVEKNTTKTKIVETTTNTEIEDSRLVFVNETSVTDVGGADTVTNAGAVNAVATAVTVEADVPVTKAGVSVSVTAAKATTQATAIDLGGGNDTLTTSGQLDAVATSVAAAANVAVAAKGGLSVSLGGPEANAKAVGISADGDGSNVETKTTIELSADSVKREKTETVSGDPEETVITTNTDLEHERIALMNETIVTNESGDDVVINRGEVAATATAVSPELDVPVAVAGVSIGVSKSMAQSEATAIDLGDGDDELTNNQLLKATATSVAVAANISVTGGSLGTSIALGGPEAEANAIGIDADGDSRNLMTMTAFEVTETDVRFMNETTIENASGDDTLTNRGDVDAVATAVSASEGAAISMTGSAKAASTSTASAVATAIRGGGGNDAITNAGRLRAISTANADVINVSVSPTGGANAKKYLWSGGISAVATSVGIDADSNGSNITTTTTIEATPDDATLLNETSIEQDRGDDTVANSDEITAVATAVSAELGIAVGVAGAGQAKATSTARAQATAIDLGGGDDELTNAGLLNATATSVALAANIPISGGGGLLARAMATGGAEADAKVVGIDADGDGVNIDTSTALGVTREGATFTNETTIENDSGDDIVTNASHVNAVATAVSPTLAVPVAIKGIAVSRTASKTRSQATAIDLGGGDDTLTTGGQLDAVATSAAAAANVAVKAGTGTAITLGGPEAEALAVGIDADGDGTNIATSTTLGVTLEGATFTNEATIENDSGDDAVTNGGDVNAVATAATLELDIPVAMAGVTVGVTAAKATTQAIAIDLGGGDDALTTSGQLDAVATSAAAAANISVAAGTGGAIGLGGPEADATAVGIDADGDGSNIAAITQIEATPDAVTFTNETIVVNDSGDDVVTTAGDVNAVATAVTIEADASVTMAGVAAGITAAKATTQATAIDLGGGDDHLTTAGQLDAVATSVAAAANIAVSAGTGLAMSLGGPEAEASAVGIDGDGDSSNLEVATGIAATSESVTFTNEILIENDSGDDTVTNEGDVNAVATAATAELDVPVALTGVTVGVTAAKATTQATAIDLGGGDDHLTTVGQLDAVATSAAAAANVTVTAGTGGAIGLGGPEANAKAVGIDADGDGRNISVTTAIEATLDGGTFTNEILIENDTGEDTVTNAGEINAVATAATGELDVTVGVTGLAVSVTAAKAGSQATAIDGGGSTDTIMNAGNLQANATSVAAALSVPVTGAGLAVALGGTEATATATGIAADGDATSKSSELAVSASTDHISVMQRDTTFIASGDDSVFNDGSITATAVTVSPDVSVAVSVQGVAAAVSAATARTQAAAIDSGDGDDTISNHGELAATAFANADTVNVSLSGNVGVNIAGNVLDGGTTAEAVATGISADGNGTRVTNERSITVDPNSIAILNRTTRENASGNDNITNDAKIDAKANAVAVSVAAAGQVVVPWAGGISAALSTSTAKSRAIAIDAGGGDDTVVNSGELNANANSTAVTGNVTFSLIGAAVSGDALWAGGTTTQATAIGIDADGEGSRIVNEHEISTSGSDNKVDKEETIDSTDGNDQITNEGRIIVDADAVSPSVSVAIGGILGAAAATSTAGTEATAIDAGDGDNEIDNTGELQVTATSTAVAVNYAVSVGAGLAVNNVWDGGTRAEATAAGILAGAGRDTVTSDALINAKATAVAPEVSVGVGGILGAAVATSTATAEVAAIDAGDGDNEINSNGKLLATAGATAVTVNYTAGLAAFAVNDVWDGGTRATATANGIKAGDGKDTVTNAARTESMATATAPAVSVALPGIIGGAISTATSETRAGAIETGADDDRITNSGALVATADANTVAVRVSAALAGLSVASDAFWDGGATADARAFGIDSGTGSDEITNGALISATADANTTSVGVAEVGFVVLPAIPPVVIITPGVAAAISTSTAISRASAITSGDENDSIANTGNVSAVANSTAKSVSVSVDAIGVGLASDAVWKGGTTATAIAKGIDAGDGTDELRSEAAIDATATATTKSTSIALTGLGASGAFAASTANASATALDGGDGDDLIMSHGALTSNASADSKGTSVSVTLVGAAAADASSSAIATAVGIGGAAGDDTIVYGHLDADGGILDVDSVAKASGASFEGTIGAPLGNPIYDGETKADATASGLTGGQGNDSLTNRSAIDAQASAETTVKSTSLGLVGFAGGATNASADAIARATGIEGGGDVDQLNNQGTVITTAIADSEVKNIDLMLVDLGSANVESSTRSIAVGMDGGTEDDEIINDAAISATANTTTTTSNASWSLVGTQGSQAGSVAQANSTGIRGGDGDDLVVNRGDITVGGTSSANTNGSSWTLAGAVGDSASLSARMTSTGLSGGDGEDSIRNEADVTVTGTATLNVDSENKTIFGRAGSGSTVTSNAAVIGIHGNSGADSIENAGSVSVTSTAKMTSNKASISFAGGASTSAFLSATSEASGMAGGDDDDRIWNADALSVVALSQQTATGGSRAKAAGSAAVSAKSSASATATGMHGGDGKNVVTNDGAIMVDANPTGTSKNTATAGFLFGTAGAVSDMNVVSTSYGIKVADGESLVANNDAIDVKARGNASANTKAAGGRLVNGSAFATARASGTGIAYGIDAGDGDNELTNDGGINVLAQPKSNADKANANGNGITNAAGTATATATSTGEAIGINVGNGNNSITNNALLTVDALPEARAVAFADSDGTARAKATATAKVTSSATGIRAGTGSNQIINNGTLDVFASFDATASADATADTLRVCIPFTDICGTVEIGSKSTKTTINVDADAFGILTGGEENQHVVNDGAIIVAAPKSQIAVGIETAGGDDVIINDGSIETIVGENSGVAIRTGAGNDTVSLGDSSSTIGSIELEAGDDSLTFSGGATVTAAAGAPAMLDGGDDIDSLTFDGAGNFDGSVVAFENTIKQGEGLFAVGALQTMQRLEVSSGTLQAGGDYEFAEAGQFDAQVYGGGANGQFLVEGQASLAGELSVQRGPGAYVDETQYNIVLAKDAIAAGTAFAAVTLPDPTPLLGFEYAQLDDAAQIVADVQPFDTMATHPLESSVAQHMDRLLPTVTGDLSNVFGHVQTLPATALGLAYANLSPRTFGQTTQVALDTTGVYQEAFSRRLRSLRVNDRTSSAAHRSTYLKEKPAALTLDGTNPTPGSASARMVTDENSDGTWIDNFGVRGSRDADGAFDGYDFETSAFIIGFDRALRSDLLVGMSLGSSWTDVEFDQASGVSEIHTTFGSLYGGYISERAYVDGTISYGKSSLANLRNIDILDLPRQAWSEHDAKVFSATFDGGYYLGSERFTWGPFADIRYTRISEDAFTETGAESINLSVDARTTSALVSGLGVMVRRGFIGGNGSYVPEASIAWIHDYGIDDAGTTAGFTGSPDFRFYAPGQAVAEDGARLSLGLSYYGKGGLKSMLHYTGELRDGFMWHGVSGQLAYEF